MNPSVAWSILTARSPALPRMPRGHGGLAREDVAVMLADCAPEAFLMGMAYECNDHQSLLDLELRLWQLVMHRSKQERWRCPSQPFLCRRLAGLALFEVMHPRICLLCNGKGTFTFDINDHPEYILSIHFDQVSEHNGRMRCLGCNGTGRLKLSARKRADLAGVHKYTWQTYWGARYQPIYDLVRQWLQDARTHLDEKLKANEGELQAPLRQ